nr:reverse transcriptase domain-containing protein [Tanacetum cinerariifolium]
MKQLIAELPMLMAPKKKEELIMYLVAAREAISAVLMTERDDKQVPIYFVSRALQGPEINYTLMEKLIITLVSAIKQEDEEKTTFITSQGIFCYSKMSFGLKDARATYQCLVDKAFQKQIGRKLKVYVDDLVIKSRTEKQVIRDIEETFKTLREINMKLNPKKCAFGMREDTFLGYKVDADGLRVCLDKVEAVLDLPFLKCLKDVQKLNGKLASLNRFLSKSAEQSLPFFKMLKKCTKKSDFQ